MALRDKLNTQTDTIKHNYLVALWLLTSDWAQLLHQFLKLLHDLTIYIENFLIIHKYGARVYRTWIWFSTGVLSKEFNWDL